MGRLETHQIKNSNRYLECEGASSTKMRFWKITSVNENDMYLLHRISDDPLLSSSTKDFDEQSLLPEFSQTVLFTNVKM